MRLATQRARVGLRVRAAGEGDAAVQGLTRAKRAGVRAAEVTRLLAPAFVLTTGEPGAGCRAAARQAGGDLSQADAFAGCLYSVNITAERRAHKGHRGLLQAVQGLGGHVLEPAPAVFAAARPDQDILELCSAGVLQPRGCDKGRPDPADGVLQAVQDPVEALR